MRKLFTSESVTEGHPDKICDQISDAIVDAIISEDTDGRIAAETAVNTGYIIIFGEITTKCYVDIAKVARDTVREIGYTDSSMGFDGNTCAVLTAIDEQSEDIAMGVNQAVEYKRGELADYSETTGAGDQGMMFGYACDETDVYMPMGAYLANKLAMKLAEVRKKGILPYLRPDGKTQVTIEYDDDKIIRVDTVVISTQHSPDVFQEKIRQDLIRYVIEPVIPKELLDFDTKYYVNPTGRFVIGGPQGDSGLTGRKIIVDTYGGYGCHGGGAFSGKDPTKVDRSGAYAARYVAKNLVAAGLCKKCQVQLAYAIGVARPVSINVDTFGTGVCNDETISNIVERVFDLRPASIIRDLDLKRPRYRKIAAYGHFGREDVKLPWENLDRVDEIKAELEKWV